MKQLLAGIVCIALLVVAFFVTTRLDEKKDNRLINLFWLVVFITVFLISILYNLHSKD